jgi:hypothetical protein
MLNASTMKLLACALMVVDHLGIIFFPQSVALRLFGRLVMPVFSYMIVEGYRHTRDVTAYLGRLLIFALCSQFIYAWAFAYAVPQMNVIFTLALGLYAVYSFEKTGSYSGLALCCVAAEAAHVSYGFPGVLMVFAIHRSFDDLKTMFVSLLGVTALMSVRSLIFKAIQEPGFQLSIDYLLRHGGITVLVEPFAACSVVFFVLYNHERGWNLKYLFYLFYPGHLAVLGIIKHWK